MLFVMAESGEPLDEIEAIRQIANALERLDPEALPRVLRWALDRYGRTQGASSPMPLFDGLVGGAERDQPKSRFEDVAALFAAAAPKKGTEAALVVGYWFQVAGGQPDFDAQSLNAELKNLGHGLANVTVTLGHLINVRPQLVIQTKKGGSTAQARKRYRLTQEGINRVLQLVKESASREG
jgi:hypothetical protein